MADEIQMCHVKVEVYEGGGSWVSTETFSGPDVYARPNEDGSLTVKCIEHGYATGFRVYAPKTWRAVSFYRERPEPVAVPVWPPASPAPVPDPEVIGAADPTPGVVQVLSGAHGHRQAGVNEDG